MNSTIARVALVLGLFILCTAVCLFGWYVVASMSLATAGPIMGGGGRSFTSGESIALIFFSLLPLLLYPACAWFFRKWLGTLPSILLGLSPLLLPILFFSMIDLLRYANSPPTNGRKEFIQEDSNGQVNAGGYRTYVTYKDGEAVKAVKVCPNGSIVSSREFDHGRNIGTHLEVEGCFSPSRTKLTAYNDAGEVTDEKSISKLPLGNGWQQTVSHTFLESTSEGQANHTFTYQWVPENDGYFVSGEFIDYKDAKFYVRRTFDQTGKLVWEERRSR